MGCGDVMGSSYVLHSAWRKTADIIMKLGMEKKTGKCLRYAFRAFVFCLHSPDSDSYRGSYSPDSDSHRGSYFQ